MLDKEITKNCKYHGETTFILEGRGYYRCKKCRSQRVTEARRRRKEKAIEYKGGSCEKCGYNKCVAALEFHHLDPTQKDFSFSAKGIARSWDKQRVELDKCILVCSNCHAEIHHAEYT